MRRRIGFLTWGNGSQLRSFQDFAAHLDDLIYLRSFDPRDLDRYAALVVPDGMDGASIRRHAGALNAYVRAGGCLVLFACPGAEDWLDVVRLEWKPIVVKDWLWWTKPGAKLEIHQPEPRHSLCDAVPLRDMGWHWKGVYAPTPHAQSALDLDDGAGSLFLDFRNLEGGGRLIATTLDPHVHNGERFMPATTRFLQGFYPWLNRELGIDRRRRGFVLTYLQCYDQASEWEPPELAPTIEAAGGTVRFQPFATLDEGVLRASDVIYLPNNQDQLLLRERQGLILGHLARGGHVIACTEPAIAWLPFLKPFRAVPPRPFANLKVRAVDGYGFFRNMPDGFDAWQGIHGQYARGWSDMPEGAVAVSLVGRDDDPKPADWLWKLPTDDGRRGYLFVHNGDNLVRYPDHGPHKNGLVRDICLELIALGSGLPRRDDGRGSALPLITRPERIAW